MKDLIKLLTKETNDLLIEYWVDKASEEIINYLKTDLTSEQVQSKYDKAIIELCVAYSRVNKDGGIISSKSQGARSVSYATSEGLEFTQSIKNLLPKPKLRCY